MAVALTEHSNSPYSGGTGPAANANPTHQTEARVPWKYLARSPGHFGLIRRVRLVTLGCPLTRVYARPWRAGSSLPDGDVEWR